MRIPLSISRPRRERIGNMIVRPIAGGVEVLAPAKLNLFLEVLGRRPDGYHEIESLMVAVDLYDTLTVRRRPVGGDHPAVRRPDACRPGATTWWSRRPSGSRPRRAVRAGRAIDAAQGDPGAGGAGGRLERRGGDAGGPRPALGPADAPRPAGRAGRRRSAATWRSSCTAPAAVCRGRGERVEPLTLARPLHFVLVCPPRRPEHGRRLPQPDDRPSGPGRSGRSWRRWPTADRPPWVGACSTGSNPSPRRSARAGRGSGTPWRASARRSTGHLMSGSGSAYFGLCRDPAAAVDAARRLEPLGLGRVRVVTCGP